MSTCCGKEDTVFEDCYYEEKYVLLVAANSEARAEVIRLRGLLTELVSDVCCTGAEEVIKDSVGAETWNSLREEFYT